MKSKEDILAKMREVLNELFDIPPENVTLEAKLYEDLDLDSIDGVDIAIRLQELTGRKLQPGEFKSVRTVRDVVALLEEILAV